MTLDRYQQAKQITLIGALINTLLGIIKLIGGFAFHSHALVADGMHSFADLITDVMVLFASKYGSQDADDSHPYGHQRFETAATLLLALLLVLAGAGIAWDAFYELWYETVITPAWWALPIAVLSVIANELLFHYTRFIGHRINSSLIVANAWHHRSDAAASLVVSLGLAASLAGLTGFDTLAAVIVGCLIIKMGLEYGWHSVTELVDTAVEPEVLAKIQEIILSFKDVKKIHQLRTRLMGGDILIDVHILVSPFISVSEGHFIAQNVDMALVTHFERVKDVIVHIDPEDDEDNCPSSHLPTRDSLEASLLNPWKIRFPDICYWTLHYLDGAMRIDLVYKPHASIDVMQSYITKDLMMFPAIKEIRFFSEDNIIHLT